MYIHNKCNMRHLTLNNNQYLIYVSSFTNISLFFVLWMIAVQLRTHRHLRTKINVTFPRSFSYVFLCIQRYVMRRILCTVCSIVHIRNCAIKTRRDDDHMHNAAPRRLSQSLGTDWSGGVGMIVNLQNRKASLPHRPRKMHA